MQCLKQERFVLYRWISFKGPGACCFIYGSPAWAEIEHYSVGVEVTTVLIYEGSGKEHINGIRLTIV